MSTVARLRRMSLSHGQLAAPSAGYHGTLAPPVGRRSPTIASPRRRASGSGRTGDRNSVLPRAARTAPHEQVKGAIRGEN